MLKIVEQLRSNLCAKPVTVNPPQIDGTAANFLVSVWQTSPRRYSRLVEMTVLFMI
jgi:hypothetical protein